jgi:NMD protein affecting ribosome stability and mRNA decay
MANRKCICPRCGRGIRFKGVCARCVEALKAMAAQTVVELRRAS